MTGYQTGPIPELRFDNSSSPKSIAERWNCVYFGLEGNLISFHAIFLGQENRGSRYSIRFQRTDYFPQNRCRRQHPNPSGVKAILITS
ncbi:hypothetical protein CH373_18470, partial [Leptospira perolatii]